MDLLNFQLNQEKVIQTAIANGQKMADATGQPFTQDNANAIRSQIIGTFSQGSVSGMQGSAGGAGNAGVGMVGGAAPILGTQPSPATIPMQSQQSQPIPIQTQQQFNAAPAGVPLLFPDGSI